MELAVCSGELELAADLILAARRVFEGELFVDSENRSCEYILADKGDWCLVCGSIRIEGGRERCRVGVAGKTIIN